MPITVDGRGGEIETSSGGTAHLAATDATVPAGGMVHVDAWLCARAPSTGGCASWEVRGLACREGGAPARIVGQQVSAAFADPQLAPANVALGVVDDRVGIWVTGVQNVGMRWHARVLLRVMAG